ncbi:hypothetical protein BGW39_002355 [Mortierella sp. 14UC]|nr:hypothetical protein BGW39_002355 [Mortierella sp. 14UC]
MRLSPSPASSSSSTNTSTYPYASMFTPEMIFDLQSQPHLSVEDGQHHIQFTIQARETILKNHRIHRQLKAYSKDQQAQQQPDSCVTSGTPDSTVPAPAAPEAPDTNSDSDSDCYLEKELSNIFQFTRMVIQRVAECNDGFEIPYPHPPGPIRMRALLGCTMLSVLSVPTPTSAGDEVVGTQNVKSSPGAMAATETITSNQPRLPSSSSSTLSLATSTASRLTIPKVVIQPPETTVATPTPTTMNISTLATKDTTVATSPTPNVETKDNVISCCSIELPAKTDAAKVSTPAETPSMSTTSKPTAIQRSLNQDTSLPLLQTNIDKFVVSSKPSISTRPVPETKEGIVKSGTSNKITSTSSKSSKTAVPAPIKLNTAPPTTPTTSTTPTTPTKPKIRTTTAALSRSKLPSPSKKPDQSVAMNTVASSPVRLKRNAFLDMLPPPTISIAQKTEKDPSEAAGVDAAVAGSKSKTSAVAPRMIKIKNSFPEAIASAAASTTIKGKSAQPTEAAPRNIKIKSSAASEPKLPSAAKKSGSDRSTTPADAASTTTRERPVAEPSSTEPISRRLGKVKPTALESKVGPIFTAAVSAVSKAVTNATASSVSGKIASKAVKDRSSSTVSTTFKTKAQSKTKNSSENPSDSTAPETNSTTTTVRSKKNSSEDTSRTKKKTSADTVVAPSRTKKKTSEDTDIPTSKSSKSSSNTDAAVKSKPAKTATVTNTATAPTAVSKDKTTTASKPAKSLTISTSPKEKSTTDSTTATTNTKTVSKDPPSRPRKSSATAPGTPPSPISLTWPTDTLDRHRATPKVDAMLEDVSMSSPGNAMISPPPAGAFSFRTSPSGIVLGLSSAHQQLENHRQQQIHTLATNPPPSFPQPQQPQPQQQPSQPQQQQPIRNSPRPKRLLELIHQDDHENNNLNDQSSSSSPSCLHYSSLNNSNHNNSFYDESSPFLVPDDRPRKRARLTELNHTNKNANIDAQVAAKAVAGRNHGIYGQMAFEQAVRAMSFKHPTTTLNTATTATTMNASRRLYEFQQRRLAASGRGSRGLGDGGNRIVATWHS